MFLDFLEKRSEEVDDTPRLTDEEKLFLKVFGIGLMSRKSTN